MGAVVFVGDEMAANGFITNQTTTKKAGTPSNHVFSDAKEDK